MIYLIDGQPGTGKTTAAGQLYAALTDTPTHRVFMLDGDVVRNMWPDTPYTDQGRADSLDYVLTLAKTLHDNYEECDVIISVVAPIVSSRIAFHEAFKTDIMEIRFTAIKEMRKADHYSTFYAGGPIPNIQGWDQFETWLEGLREKIEREHYGAPMEPT